MKQFRIGKLKTSWLTLLDWVLVVLTLALMLYFPRFDVPLVWGVGISYVLIIGGVIHIAGQYFLQIKDSVSAAGVIYYILLLLSVSAPAIWAICFIHFVVF